MHLIIKLFIYGGIFFKILILLWHFFLCDKHSVIISKVHNESIIFLKLIHNF
jgi:hypothetical protein